MATTKEQKSTKTKAKAEPKKDQNLVSLMRKIRSELSGWKFVKVKDEETVWIIDGKVELSLNYACRWTPNDELKQEFKTCHPKSVRIRAHTEGLAAKLVDYRNCSVNPSAVFNTRTIPRRQDGTISLDSIAVAVTKCSESYGKFIKDNHDRHARYEAAAEARRKVIWSIRQVVPIAKEQPFIEVLSDFSLNSKTKVSKWDKLVEIQVSPIDIDSKEAGAPEIEVKLNRLTLEEVTQLGPALKQLVLNREERNAKAKSSKQGGNGSDSPTDNTDQD